MKLFPILLFPFMMVVAATAQTPPRNENTVVLNATGVANLGIETTTVGETSFEKTIPVLGEIEHTCDSHSVLSSRIAGKIIEVLLHKGEFAKEGEVVLKVESRQAGDPPPVIELKAPADGLVIESEAHLGAPVEPEKELMEILDLSRVWVVARVPQHQAAILKKGLVAKIRVPALGNEEMTAEYLRPGTGSNTISVEAVFSLPNPGNKMRPGMRAEIALVASKRDGVVSIPRDALQGDRSNRFVFIKDYELKDAFERVPVTVGETSGDRVEITKGLLPGDEVVTRGAYSLAFAGKGSASLKEALDAAHGHPHNEDGTEMSKEQIAAEAAAKGGEHGHDHGAATGGPLVVFLAIACGVLLVLLLASPCFFRARAKA
jgi:cobalt-zinc-cadmium efflux system membrane fusion protein